MDSWVIVPPPLLSPPYFFLRTPYVTKNLDNLVTIMLRLVRTVYFNTNIRSLLLA